MVKIAPHHAKYLAFDLTRRATEGIDRLSMSLFDAQVDLNPHQIEAALFTLQSPLSKGVILADEVGLGKTIEAGIVLCQYWAERKRRILVICPASIRKQWALELEEKFNIPTLVLDSKSLKEWRKEGNDPFSIATILIMSFNFANSIREEIRTRTWDLVVIDEAHKLRNAYRLSNKVGQGIRWATEDCRKILLTATPLQNSLMELYGLSTLIDEHIFGDPTSFRAQYANSLGNINAFRQRLSTFCKRTLRNQVSEYVRYTERRAITRPFRPTDNEQALYEAISDFLRREECYALPKRQKHLTALILRKLLASSSQAIAATLDMLYSRLENLLANVKENDEEFTESLIENEDIEDDLLDEILAEESDQEFQSDSDEINIDRLKEEITTLRRLATWAHSIGEDTKSKALIKALEIGFEQMDTLGAARKAVIFTESRKTQDYLKNYLENHGYRGQIVLFNGSNNDPETTAIYSHWLEINRETGRSSGSREIDVRTALIEHFRDNATFMIATEAAAEGINLQFCSLVVNYDLPWNPQRIEQRIGRCHRYGQKFDVVVINFLNERNEADRRVLELLSEKFKLFSGIFGASDEVLVSIESGVDFEKRILAIYQECRTPEEIDAAFTMLQEELDAQIRSRLDDTRHALFEYFDEDVHQRLRLRLADTQNQLDRVSRRFWMLTQYILAERAKFHEAELAFDLYSPPRYDIFHGRYHLISKSTPKDASKPSEEVAEGTNRFLYRISHPLGEYVIDQAKQLETAPAEIVFDLTHHPTKVSVLEGLKGTSGYLVLTRLCIESYEQEEYLLFSGITDKGKSLDQETLEKLFVCDSFARTLIAIPEDIGQRLSAEAEQHAKATINKSLERNNRYFNEAREKLEKWADDMVYTAEKALTDIKEQIKALRRQARQATTIEEQHAIQEQMLKLERQQRRQRQEIFRVEDEIMVKRDELIDQLEKRLTQKTVIETLFAIRWVVE